MRRRNSEDDRESIAPLPGIDLAAILDAIAERLASRLQGTVPQRVDADEPLLLTIEQTARKLGRSVPATEHLIRAGKLRGVRIDRRVYVDYRDILTLIEQSKDAARGAHDEKKA